jgi:prevent-host-death family protein
MIIAKRRKLQDVKAHFSQVVDEVLAAGPQVVTRHGKDTVVLVSLETFEALHAPQESFVDFMLSAPRVELDVERSQDGDREISM